MSRSKNKSIEQQLSFSLGTSEGNTKTKPKVRKHIDEKPDTYKGMYAMHKYWSKKPHNLVASYIKRFSNEGDVILDTFCGSGVTVIESVRLGRLGIGIDINPISILSTRMALEHINIKDLETEFERVKNNIMDKINSLYFTPCPICGFQNAIVTHTVWSKSEILEMWVECNNCDTSKTIKTPTEHDMNMALIPSLQPTWYPNNELVENPRVNVKAGTRVSDLFTLRALTALSLLLDTIRETEDEEIKGVLEYCFSATLSQASKLVFVIRRRGKSNTNGSNQVEKAEVGSWVIGYWIPKEHFEINAWRCFDNRFRRILRGKQEVNKVIPRSAVEYSSVNALLNRKTGYFVNIGTAESIPIPDDSVDYIFTDPPHGNRIPYLELSLMWNSWLGFETEWNKEIIVTEAKTRDKGVEEYLSRLDGAIKELWRVLKPNKYLSVAFNSLDDQTWLSLLNIFLRVGFKLTEVRPLEYSARSVVQDTRKNALKTDFVITLQKVLPKIEREIEFSTSQAELENDIFEYISKKQGAMTYDLLNMLLIKRISTGFIFKISEIINSLQENYTWDNGYWMSRKHDG